jgi:hypothetical protein
VDIVALIVIFLVLRVSAFVFLRWKLLSTRWGKCYSQRDLNISTVRTWNLTSVPAALNLSLHIIIARASIGINFLLRVCMYYKTESFHVCKDHSKYLLSFRWWHFTILEGYFQRIPSSFSLHIWNYMWNHDVLSLLRDSCLHFCYQLFHVVVGM